MSGLQTAHQDVIGNALKAGFQNFVDQSATITATATTGTPATGYFHSTVVGRATIPDIKNDLRASLGIERITVQQIMQLQNEFGSNGEPVCSVVNDDRGLIRFIGNWTNSIANSGTAPVGGVNGADYVEVTFYGTDLNVLIPYLDGSNRGYTVSVDGVGSTAVTVSGSLILVGNNSYYNPNIVVPLNLGLTLGVHTVKIRYTNVVSYIGGFDIINSNASGLMNINAGLAYIGGQKVLNAVVDSVHYSKDINNNALLPVGRGGRVVRYLKDDSTIGQAVQAVDAVSAYFPSADHTNEEMVRANSWREFGSGRPSNDDFATITTGAGNASRAYTLDDGTTTLVGVNIGIDGSTSYLNYWDATAATWFVFTFVGTGLDIMFRELTNIRVTNITIDNATNILLTQGTSANKLYKIASGLPYGTHVARLYAAPNSANPPTHCPITFYTYQPKKPTVPNTAVEICDYNVMATYVANTVCDGRYVGAGVLKKMARRELWYTGTWTQGLNTDVCGGWPLMTTTNGATAQLTFFGTGFDIRFYSAATIGANAFQVSVDGSTNLTGFTTSFYGYAGHSLGFSAASGQMTGNSMSLDAGLSVSGLTLGVHKVLITYNNPSAAAFWLGSIDEVTPIHAVKSNLYADFQSTTLPIGSCALTDSRKVSAVKEYTPSQKAWVQTIGILPSPSTTASASPGVPIPDIGLMIKTAGNPVEISFFVDVSISAAPNDTYIRLMIDGVQVYVSYVAINQTSSAAGPVCHGHRGIYPVSAGVHKIEINWHVSGGTTMYSSGTYRIVTAKEI